MQQSAYPWSPVQVLEYLDDVLDSGLGKIYIPECRLLKAQLTISEILQSLNVSAGRLVSFVGQTISMSIVLGHTSQIMTRKYGYSECVTLGRLYFGVHRK